MDIDQRLSIGRILVYYRLSNQGLFTRVHKVPEEFILAIPSRNQTNQEPDQSGSCFDNIWRRWWHRLVRLGFHLLYNEMAWTYDSVSWLVSMGQWRAWQRAALPYIHGPRVLELAHGPGHMLLDLHHLGNQVFGVDRSPSMGRLACRKLKKSGETPLLTRGDARNLPFAPDSFNSILSTFPTEFIVDESTILSLHSTLKPGGRLVIVPEARLKKGGLIKRIIEGLYSITGQRIEPADNSWSAHIWLVAEKRFLSAGFETEIVQVDLGDSEVTVIVAYKLADDADKAD